MVTVVTIPTPQLALAAAATAGLTALFWLFFYLHSRRPRPRLSYEIVDGRDIALYDEKIALAGKDFAHIGQMPASFVCSHCGGTECISLQMYHHIPTHTMILLSRHKCWRLSHAEMATVPMASVPVMPERKIRKPWTTESRFSEFQPALRR